MSPAPVPVNEADRLEALRRYDILDTEAEAEFDDFTRLAARICRTPIAQITFVDRHRQWYKSNFGVDLIEISRDIGFCAHAILGEDVLEIHDARADERFINNPLVVEDPQVRFYAGAPLVAPDGSNVGALCVVDTQPRELNDEQRDALTALSRQIVRQLELRVALKRERQINDELALVASHLQNLNQQLNKIASDRKEQLSDAEERLRQSNRAEALGLLAGGIAHDFTNILAVINVTAEIASARLPKGDPVQRDLADIVKIGQQAGSITRQLLGFGREQTGTATSFNLNDVVRSFQTLLSRFLPGSIVLNVELSRAPLLVNGDRAQIEQVLLNLAINARDAMPEGGTLGMRTAVTEDHRAQLVVSDTGCGMDAETQAQIFEPFFTTKGPQQGSGLGLSTVRSIVATVGGDIAVTSAHGTGTTFVIGLPLLSA